MGDRPDVVVVDHYDSYTWNLVHLVAAVTGVLPGSSSTTRWRSTTCARFSHVVLSPGPGHPDDAADFAVGREVLRAAATPVLGVCLGMQGLVAAYGGRVGAVEPAHGDVAAVAHDGTGLFAGRARRRSSAVRYHSLAAVEVPDALRGDRARRAGRRWSWASRTATLPLSGCSSTPSRCSPSTVPRLVGELPGGRREPSRGPTVTSDEHVPSWRAAAASDRMFWLDGGGARPWSGTAVGRLGVLATTTCR